MESSKIDSLQNFVFVTFTTACSKHRLMRKSFLVTILTVCFFGLHSQDSPKRVALIIGAQNYTMLPPLRNSLNDAKAISSLLKTKGFQVETLADPKTKREVRDAITRYYNLMRDQVGAVGVIFYAGHGMQYEGDNYLIPTTASLQNPGDLEDQCVKMNTIMAVLKSSSKSLNILLLDACRSLPSFTRDTDQGLTRMEAPQGSIIVFATQPGKVASDGVGQNGLFTSKFLRVIEKPNLNITDVFKEVKQQVYAESGEKQLPSVEDNSIGGDFYFTKKQISVTSTPVSFSKPGANNAAEIFKQSEHLYDISKYAEAFPLVSKSAESGFGPAQALLSKMYLDGKGVLMDETEAVKWCHKSVEQGDGEGQMFLGFLYEFGRGIPKDKEEAVKWYRKSAEQGNANGQRHLGFMYQEGHGVGKNEEEAAKWYAKAVEWYTKSAEQGNANDQRYLGFMYEFGHGIPQDYAEAVRLYKNSAEQGNEFGQYNLGRMYYHGHGVSKDHAEAVKWYQKAAENGSSYAQSSLGYMYEKGLGVSKNEVAAVEWYKKSAEQDDGNGQTNLGYMYENGFGVSKDYAEALKWYRKAAEQGNANGQNHLGYLYDKGFGVTEDNAEALNWYRKSAEQDNAYGQNNLGLMYLNGFAIQQDEAEAAKWFQKSADQGNANGQANLGYVYETGRGVTLNKDTAISWYKKAVLQNNQYAKDRLSAMGVTY